MSNTLKKSIHLIIALVCSATLFLAGAFIVPKPIAIKADVPSEFTNVSFGNFDIAGGNYTYDSNVRYVASGELGEDIDMKYFSGYVKFTGAPRLYIGGSADGKGLRISTISNGAALSAYWGNTRITNLVTAKAGITFKNTEFLFGVTFKKVDADSDSAKDDLELTFWFNGNTYDNGAKFYAYNVSSDFGDFVSIECPSSSAGLEIRNDSNAGAITDKNLNKISSQHFGIEDNTYGYNNNMVAVSGTYLLGTQNSNFSANVKFSATEGAALHYAAQEKDGGLGGFVFKLENGNLVLTENLTGENKSWTFTANNAGLTSFVDTTFKLGVTLKTVNKDEGTKDNDIELGIWFNDVLYENTYIYLLDQIDNLGNALGIYSPVDGSTVTMGVVSGMEITIPNPDLDKITFDRFNIADGEYSSSIGDIAKFGDSNKSLANTYFSGEVKFNGGAHFIYGNANGAQWTGALRIYPANSTTFAVVNHNATAQLALIPVSQTPLTSTYEEFRLGISLEVIDNDNDGEKDDVKIGFYFNEDLWDGGFIYQNDYVQYIGTGMSFYTATGTSIKVGVINALKAPIVSRPVPEDLTKITLETVGISDGTYGFNANNFAIRSSYKKSWENTIFSAAVKFSPTTTAEFMYAMTGEGWSGLRFQAINETTMRLWIPNLSNKMVYFYADSAGLDSFLGEQFYFSISTRYVDSDNDGLKDDVELGVWFNDILYKDEYIYLVDYAEKMKNQSAVNLFADKSGASITIKSRIDYIPPIIYEKMPEGLTKITLNDFTINDGVVKYRNNDLGLNSAYDKSLDNTYCEFYVTPSSTTKEMTIRYGGGGWSGLAIRFYDDKIAAYDASGRSSSYTLLAKNSKMTSFTNQTYLLGISTQYMDLDNDGEKDDVRFGIWANGTLCGNEYVDIKDYVQYMGKRFAVYIAEDGATLELKSIMIPIDFELFGFTTNWATELAIHASGTTTGGSSTGSSSAPTQSPQTGDTLVRPMLFSCVALGGLINTENSHRRKLFVR